MRPSAGIPLLLLSVCLQAQSAEHKTTLTGKLVRVMALGGESTGWSLELDSANTVGRKQLDSMQVHYRKNEKLEELANKHVKATGKIVHRHGMETGDYPVLEISSIKEVKVSAQAAQASPPAMNLIGTEWRLEDIEGRAVIEHSQATLAFQGAEKVSGNGSCNRYFGPAEIHGDTLRLGPFASSRMACAEPVMSQEARFLEVLQSAERFEWKDPYLLIYCKGLAKPLRFTRMMAGKPGTP